MPELIGKAGANTLQVRLTAESPNAERERILKALEEAKGQVGGPDGAASRLGLKRTTLQSRMRKYNIARQFGQVKEAQANTLRARLPESRRTKPATKTIDSTMPSPRTFTAALAHPFRGAHPQNSAVCATPARIRALSSLVQLLHGAGACLHLTDVGFVVGILDDDFRCAENSRLRYRVVQGRQPELINARIPLHHLHAANPE